MKKIFLFILLIANVYAYSQTIRFTNQVRQTRIGGIYYLQIDSSNTNNYRNLATQNYVQGYVYEHGGISYSGGQGIDITNGVVSLNSVQGFFAQGSNVVLSGSGTLLDPYVISATGTGGSTANSNVGSSYRWVVAGTQNIKTFANGVGFLLDSATSNTLTGKIDTLTMSTRLWRQKGIDSVVGLLGNYALTSSLSSYVLKTTSVGTGYGLLGGGTLDANRTHRVDTTLLETKLSHQKAVDSLGAIIAAAGVNIYTITGDNNISGGNSNYGSLSSGANNTAIGSNLLNAVSSGSGNIAIGSSVLPRLTSASNMISIGYNNFKNVTVSNLNSNAGIAIGRNNNGYIKYKNLSIGIDNIGSNVDSATAVSAIAADNMAIGVSNLANIRAGIDNMVFSWDGLNVLDSGSNNNVFGQYGLEALLDGNSNQSFGWRAGARINHGSRNIFIGDSAAKGAFITSNNSIFIGSKTMYNTVTSLSNAIVIGDSATISQNNLAVIGKTGTWLAVGRATATESIHTNGAILIGAASATTNGTIQWDGSDFLGRKSGVWVSLTTGMSGTLAVSLTDGATINTDASLGYVVGSTYRVTLGGNRTIANPTNLTDGQRIIYEIKQDATGSRTVSWGSKFTWSDDIPLPTLSTSAGYVDFVSFVYNSSADKLYVTGTNIGVH